MKGGQKGQPLCVRSRQGSRASGTLWQRGGSVRSRVHTASGAVGMENRQEDQTQQVAKERKCSLSELREAHPVRVEVGQAASGHR